MRTLMRNSLLASLVSLTCGCGGDDSSRTGADAPVPYDPCEESRSLDRVMVADFEMQPAVDWSTNSDGTTTNLSPVPTNTLITAIEAPKCPDEASAGSGFQVIATGLQGFGYTFTFNNLGVLQGTGATHFDAAEWDGISMWVRKGTGPSASSIFASVADRFTEPSPAAAQLFSAEEAEALLPPGKCPAASMGGPATAISMQLTWTMMGRRIHCSVNATGLGRASASPPSGGFSRCRLRECASELTAGRPC
jgi:hypothetical protein